MDEHCWTVGPVEYRVRRMDDPSEGRHPTEARLLEPLSAEWARAPIGAVVDEFLRLAEDNGRLETRARELEGKNAGCFYAINRLEKRVAELEAEEERLKAACAVMETENRELRQARPTREIEEWGRDW